MNGAALLERHVELFNRCVGEGDFAAFVELFSDDAVMRFVGIPVGPFHGREQIAEAYRTQPPDDTMHVLRSRVAPDRILAEYAWDRTPRERGGDLILLPRGERISALTIVYGGDDRLWR
jgi:steroid Delta-isomerase